MVEVSDAQTKDSESWENIASTGGFDPAHLVLDRFRTEEAKSRVRIGV